MAELRLTSQVEGRWLTPGHFGLSLLLCRYPYNNKDPTICSGCRDAGVAFFSTGTTVVIRDSRASRALLKRASGVHIHIKPWPGFGSLFGNHVLLIWEKRLYFMQVIPDWLRKIFRYYKTAPAKPTPHVCSSLFSNLSLGLPSLTINPQPRIASVLLSEP